MKSVPEIEGRQHLVFLFGIPDDKIEIEEAVGEVLLPDPVVDAGAQRFGVSNNR